VQPPQRSYRALWRPRARAADFGARNGRTDGCPNRADSPHPSGPETPAPAMGGRRRSVRKKTQLPTSAPSAPKLRRRQYPRRSATPHSPGRHATSTVTRAARRGQGDADGYETSTERLEAREQQLDVDSSAGTTQKVAPRAAAVNVQVPLHGFNSNSRSTSIDMPVQMYSSVMTVSATYSSENGLCCG